MLLLHTNASPEITDGPLKPPPVNVTVVPATTVDPSDGAKMYAAVGGATGGEPAAGQMKVSRSTPIAENCIPCPRSSFRGDVVFPVSTLYD
jgi:hypothetical protein